MNPVKRNILLNPGPATTSDGVKNALVVPDICPREKEFGDLMDRIRAGLTRVVHSGDEYKTVLFAGSGTAAMEAAMCSIPAPDKKVLIHVNGAYGRRFQEIASVYGLNVVAWTQDYGAYPDPGELEKLLAENPQINSAFFVHHETTTGMLNPIAECARLAGKRGVKVIVDAMSSYAGIPLDVKELGIDFLISSSNKCIQGMAGLSFVICRKTSLALLPRYRRSYYLDLGGQDDYFEKTRQMQFTPPVQVCYALEKALQEYERETGPGRSKRYADNWETLYEGLRKIGFRFLLPRKQESGILLAVLEPEDPAYDFEAMHDYLYGQGFTIYPGKGARESAFRLAILGDLTPEDVRNFLTALENYIKEAGITKF